MYVCTWIHVACSTTIPSEPINGKHEITYISCRDKNAFSIMRRRIWLKMPISVWKFNKTEPDDKLLCIMLTSSNYTYIHNTTQRKNRTPSLATEFNNWEINYKSANSLRMYTIILLLLTTCISGARVCMCANQLARVTTTVTYGLQRN